MKKSKVTEVKELCDIELDEDGKLKKCEKKPICVMDYDEEGCKYKVTILRLK